MTDLRYIWIKVSCAFGKTQRLLDILDNGDVNI